MRKALFAMCLFLPPQTGHHVVFIVDEILHTGPRGL